MPVALQCRIPLVDTYAGEQTVRGVEKRRETQSRLSRKKSEQAKRDTQYSEAHAANLLHSIRGKRQKMSTITCK